LTEKSQTTVEDSGNDNGLKQMLRSELKGIKVEFGLGDVKKDKQEFRKQAKKLLQRPECKNLKDKIIKPQENLSVDNFENTEHHQEEEKLIHCSEPPKQEPEVSEDKLDEAQESKLAMLKDIFGENYDEELFRRVVQANANVPIDTLLDICIYLRDSKTGAGQYGDLLTRYA